MLISTMPGLVATPAIPILRLPASYITMVAVYGQHSYFDLILSDVPSGFDIANGTYRGWCVQQNIIMTQHVNHTVRLYSCYDPLLPLEYHNDHWDKINYLLNHKQGDAVSIQLAIWFYTNDMDCTRDLDARAMISDAEQHGSGFIPSAGELLAVPVEGVPTVQLTFLEVTIPAPSMLEGLVWDDTNANGLQENGEPGMNNIVVFLYQQNNFLLSTTITNDKGQYHFTNLSVGSYYLQFTLPPGYHFSPQDVGTNDSFDSDVDIVGITPVFQITTLQSTQRWDAGMYFLRNPRPSVPRNHPPTADATAGEPYNGFLYEPLKFDGSRSYDRDGRIITWFWTFGDGNTGTGETTTHTYNQTGEYTVTLTVTDNQFASDTYITTAHIAKGNNPPSTPTISGPFFGHALTLYEFFFIASDIDNDTIRFIVDWDDGHTDTTTYFPGGRTISLTHLWETFGFYTIHVYAQDSLNSISSLSHLSIAIDVRYVAHFGYLIDSNGDGTFDVFYSNTTDSVTRVKLLDTGKYLIDTNGDSIWDIIYDPSTNQYQQYHETPTWEYLIFMLLIILFAILYQMMRVRRRTRTFYSRKK